MPEAIKLSNDAVSILEPAIPAVVCSTILSWAKL